MKPARYEIINRDAFVKNRYDRYVAKKKFLTETGMLPDYAVLSDLDQPQPGMGGKLLKDVVICDACNEDILETEFAMLEKEKCYHLNCAPNLEYNNVAFIGKKKK